MFSLQRWIKLGILRIYFSFPLLGKNSWDITWRSRLKYQICHLEYSSSSGGPVHISLSRDYRKKLKCTQQMEIIPVTQKGMGRGLMCLQLTGHRSTVLGFDVDVFQVLHWVWEEVYKDKWSFCFQTFTTETIPLFLLAPLEEYYWCLLIPQGWNAKSCTYLLFSF